MKKKCTVCCRKKELEQFYENKNTSDGRGSQCRRCDTDLRRIRRRERKLALVKLLGGKCSRCSYSRCLAALDFHHRDENKEEEISRILMASMERATCEAMKCDLVCANCHREIHDEEAGPLREIVWTRRGEIKHGTVPGYKRCVEKCDACKDAWRCHHAERRKKAKAKAKVSN